MTPIRLLPTFADACRCQPVFLRLSARYLQPHGFAIPWQDRGSYQRYTGDTAIPGKGEIAYHTPGSRRARTLVLYSA
jgi:hypothetical protein